MNKKRKKFSLILYDIFKSLANSFEGFIKVILSVLVTAFLIIYLFTLPSTTWFMVKVILPVYIAFWFACYMFDKTGLLEYWMGKKK